MSECFDDIAKAFHMLRAACHKHDIDPPESITSPGDGATRSKLVCGMDTPHLVFDAANPTVYNRNELSKLMGITIKFAHEKEAVR